MMVGVGGFLVLLCIHTAYSQPAGCTEIDGLYECDYSTVSIPISSASFSSPPAQRIRISDITGTVSLTTALFNSDFNNLDQSATFDSNFAPTLELKCSGTSAVTLGQNAFTYMGHIYDFKIINCGITAPDNAFSELGTLDRFIIENGTITTFGSLALNGVSVEKTNNVKVSTGELVIRDSPLNSGTFPATFLNGQRNLISLTLEGLELTSLDASLLSHNTKLRHLSLGYNSFSELPSGLLDGLDSMAELHLYDTEVDCTCSQLWMYSHAETTRMKISGDIICSSPSNWENKKASVYYYSECVTIPESCTGGLVLMGACIAWVEFAMYIVCIIAFILAIVVLILAIHTKRQVGGGGAAKGKKGGPPRKRPPPKKGAPKGAKMGWS